MSAATTDMLWLRARAIQAIRHFFITRGYLEVETPIRIPAPAPEAHIIPFSCQGWYLQASPELCMKRLLSRGISKIFQLCKCFRNEERGSRHLPEMTMLEWYHAGYNYWALMDEVEALFGELVEKLFAKTALIYRDKDISFARPWERLTVEQAFEQFASMSMTEALVKECFDLCLVEEIEPKLGQKKPTFLYDYPASLGALARLKAANPSVAERFELYIGGLELANGFSELTDSEEQRSRFLDEQKMIARSGRQPGPMPENFLDELQLMPEAAGIALGVDRLIMVLGDCAQIDQTVAFPPESS